MNTHTTFIKDLFVLEIPQFEDERGCFTKIFNNEQFQAKGLDTNFQEIYYSISQKNVIRGMHFQSPPYEHNKLVYVSAGKILDVVLDIRKSSETFGKYFSITLSNNKRNALYIPKGCAHGFLSLETDTIVNYAQTTGYSKEYDNGVLYNSFGLNWPLKEPIISKRDRNFSPLSDFNSPFK